MPKNAETTAQLHSSHTLVKQCSKFSKPRFNNTWTVNFQMFKLVLEKAEEPEIKLPTSAGSEKKFKALLSIYWEYTEELYQKDPPDPDNHDGVITHPESDILECEIKWAVGSITTTKLVEVMEFQLSYFISWKMMLWKCCTQYPSKFGKLSSGHRTGKHQFPFQSQRKEMSKNAQTTAQLHSSHMLVK